MYNFYNVTNIFNSCVSIKTHARFRKFVGMLSDFGDWNEGSEYIWEQVW